MSTSSYLALADEAHELCGAHRSRSWRRNNDWFGRWIGRSQSGGSEEECQNAQLGPPVILVPFRRVALSL